MYYSVTPMGRGGIGPGGRRAYFDGKAFDHTKWLYHLPRNITPMNIDCSIDSYGNVVIMEWSRETADWFKLKEGPHRHIRSLIANMNGLGVAVCLRHDTPRGRFADTTRCLDYFTAMYYDPNNYIATDGICYRTYPAGLWVPFVQCWLLDRRLLPII